MAFVIGLYAAGLGGRALHEGFQRNGYKHLKCKDVGVIFGYTEAQFAQFFLTYGVAAFIGLMLFIIGHLAWESKAGKFGTLVLFLGLAVGFIGFIAKVVIQWYLER